MMDYKNLIMLDKIQKAEKEEYYKVMDRIKRFLTHCWMSCELFLKSSQDLSIHLQGDKHNSTEVIKIYETYLPKEHFSLFHIRNEATEKSDKSLGKQNKTSDAW